MNLDNLSIIILNYNNAKLSISTAKSLLSFGRDFKIIIVDNCSSDNSKSILSGFKMYKNLVIRFNDKNTGYAAGNNYGAREAFASFPNTKYICIMNPDVQIPDDIIFEKLINILNKSNEIGAITAETILNGKYSNKYNQSAWKFFDKKTMILQGGVLGRLLYRNLYYKEFKENYSNIAYVDVVQGCFFIMRKVDFEAIGGFDENTFLYYEEMIMAKRLKRINKRCAVLLGSYIHHNHKEKDNSMKIKSKKYYDMKCYLDSRLYYLENYFEASLLYKFIASRLLYLDYRLKMFLLRVVLRD